MLTGFSIPNIGTSVVRGASRLPVTQKNGQVSLRTFTRITPEILHSILFFALPPTVCRESENPESANSPAQRFRGLTSEAVCLRLLRTLRRHPNPIIRDIPPRIVKRACRPDAGCESRFPSACPSIFMIYGVFTDRCETVKPAALSGAGLNGFRLIKRRGTGYPYTTFHWQLCLPPAVARPTDACSGVRTR